MKVKWTTEKKEICAQGAKKLFLLLIVPFAAFYMMQFIFGGMPWEYSFSVALGNALCIGALYYVFCAATGRPGLCGLITVTLAAVWGAANYYVASFRGNPILPWDLTALGTALNVSGSYHFSITGRMAFALLILAALTAWILRRRKEGRLRLGGKGRVAALLCAVFCFRAVFYSGNLQSFGISTDVWDQAKAYRESGILGAFIGNLEFLDVDVPTGYSAGYAEELLAAASSSREGNEEIWLSRSEGTAETEEKPHIIAIMNESWADFEAFGNLELTQEAMGYIHSLDAMHGYAYTSVFGAGTSASEFEFLTGNTMAFLPPGSIPYQQYVLHPTQSLASILKENGYTCLAFHPGERNSWQRDQAYPLLGFDSFKCGADMDVEAKESHGYINDQSDFNQIIWEFENREPGEKLFLFNVTIQSHGSYTDPNYPATVQLADEPGRYPMAEQYLSLVKETDEAFRTLIEYFEKQDEPVIILMFGDHQPSLEQEFLDKAYGVKQEDMTMEEYMGKFRVPFLVWSNTELAAEDPGIMSLNFLGQYLLSCAGIDGGEYGDFLREFRQEIPALTFSGYFDAEGNAHSHLETNAYDEKIEEYQIVQYQEMFGTE